MRAAMAGADAVVHNAGWYELGLSAAGQAGMRAINVAGTANTLGLAVELGVPRILHVSSVAAFGESGPGPVDEAFARRTPPCSVYEETKTAAHAIAADHIGAGAPVIIACPSQAIGPGDHSDWGFFQRLFARGIFPATGWARAARHALTHVDDVAEGIALAAERGRIGETYLLAGEIATVEQVMRIWARHPGGLPAAIWLPPGLAAALGAAVGPAMRVVGLPAHFSRETVAGLLTNYAYSGAKAERELGARFRGQEQMWAETLAAERARIRDGREGPRS
jgi:dihydroflavonol-4-reductase